MKRKLIIGFILFFCLGCASLSLYQQQIIAEAIGKHASFFILKNNQRHIPKIEVALKVAIEMADDDSVNLNALITSIVEYMSGLQNDPEFAEYSALIKSDIESFQGLFLDLDFSVPEEYQRALARVRGFLDGALIGLEIVKGG